MKMVSKRRLSLLLSILLWLLLATAVFAQADSLTAHTIQLNYRQAEDVMPLLRPFLHPKGMMTGEGYKILVKTTAENLRDLQQFAAEIDVAQHQLRISVTVDSALAMAQNRAMAEARRESDGKQTLAGPVTKRYSTARRDKSALTRQVQVQEGKWASVSTGESIPVGQRKRNPDGTVTEIISYKSVTSGFQVLPRLSGEQVTLFIRPQLDSQSPQGGGRINTRQAETTVRGKLNHWILIGGVAEAAVSQPGSRVYSTQTRKESHNQIYVKVEVIQ